jgi:hypothetical protein
MASITILWGLGTLAVVLQYLAGVWGNGDF